MSESPETTEIDQDAAAQPAEGVGAEVDETVVAPDGDSAVADDVSLAGAGAGAVEGVGDATDDADDEDDDDAENPLETEAEVAADYLEELLDIADLDGDIDTFIEGDRAHVSIVSESQVLVGPDGSVLDALQELTRLAVMTETGNRSRLMLDVAGYRDTRRQQLLQVAGEAVERVQSAGERVALEPMNPFERKIVHDAVAAAGLVSESEGEEPRRHVVVLPAS
jgi:spoIIIJ-associated protein